MNKLLFLCLILTVSHITAQEIIKTRGKGEVEFPISLSEEQAQKLAKEQANISALEAAFGTVIIDGSAIYITNKNTSERSESKSVYNFISNKAVNGEVLETLSENYQIITKTVESGNDQLKIRFMQCSVEISARQLTSPPIQFQAYPLACAIKKCKSIEYRDGDDFFFYFNSPVSGYAWIYLDDGANAQCLLPYRDMPVEQEGGFPVKADAEYIFFSNSAENHHLKMLNFSIDTYQLSAEKEQDLNRVFVIFSEKPLAKPKLDSNGTAQSLTEEDKKANYAVPKSLRSEEFQKWLMRNRSYKTNQISLNIFDITISKH